MPETILLGGLYASRDSDGQYRISKVLALDERIVHLRSYADRFAQLPEQIHSGELSLGGLGSGDAFAIGHFPLAREAFEHETKILLGHEEVTYEELDGYRIWAGIDPVE